MMDNSAELLKTISIFKGHLKDGNLDAIKFLTIDNQLFREYLNGNENNIYTAEHVDTLAQCLNLALVKCDFHLIKLLYSNRLIQDYVCGNIVTIGEHRHESEPLESAAKWFLQTAQTAIKLLSTENRNANNEMVAIITMLWSQLNSKLFKENNIKFDVQVNLLRTLLTYEAFVYRIDAHVDFTPYYINQIINHRVLIAVLHRLIQDYVCGNIVTIGEDQYRHESELLESAAKWFLQTAQTAIKLLSTENRNANNEMVAIITMLWSQLNSKLFNENNITLDAQVNLLRTLLTYEAFAYRIDAHVNFTPYYINQIINHRVLIAVLPSNSTEMMERTPEAINTLNAKIYATANPSVLNNLNEATLRGYFARLQNNQGIVAPPNPVIDLSQDGNNDNLIAPPPSPEHR